jgi:hypothetical protein
MPGSSGDRIACDANAAEAHSISRGKGMSPWKNHLVAFTTAFLSFSLSVFLVTGYTALYWAWLRADLQTALPYLPWARTFGMLAIAGAAAALGIVFSSKAFPLPPKTRLSLSLLATVAIAFFSEFRNEGKFYFKNLVNFFGPGTWAHDGLSQLVSSLGDFLYRIEYSHWNDFLTSALARIDPGMLGKSDPPPHHDDATRAGNDQIGRPRPIWPRLSGLARGQR